MSDRNAIYEEILTEKENREELQELTSDSRTSDWKEFAWIISYICHLLSQMFTTHKEETETAIRNQKVHRSPLIRQTLLDFQYGFSLIPGTDEWMNGTATDEEIETSKIIKYAAVVESDDEKRVICKIATENDDELSPITEEQLEAVVEFVKEIKPPGVPYTVINYLPDLLRLNIRIFRDPLVLTANGIHRVNGTKPVEVALMQFMKELPFNGELQLQELANKLEASDGGRLVQVDSAETAWLDADNGSYGDFEAIDVRTIPASGYFKIVDFTGISYVV